MIPRIDPEVKYKGSSYLRTLNSDNLRDLTGAVVIQDAGSEPLVVILPYRTYLLMQKEAQARQVLSQGVDTSLRVLDAVGPELASGRGKVTTEVGRPPRAKEDKRR